MHERARPAHRHSSRQSEPDRALEDEDAGRRRQPSDGSHTPDPGGVLGLQRTFGNLAVQRWIAGLRPERLPHEYHLSNAQPFVAAISRADSDAEPDDEEPKPIDTPAVLDALSKTQAPTVEPEEGQSVHLPDVAIPEAFDRIEHDAIASTLAYVGSVKQAGTPSRPTNFGSTKWNNFKLTDITVTRTAGVFTVKALLVNPITFSVQSRGRTNIASENDGALTDDNYLTASGDLTPDSSKLNGRPPRAEFWAEDLTIRHEMYHAIERFQLGELGVATAQAWLSAQAVASVADVQRLLNEVPPRVVASSQAAAPMPAKEERAYGEGAPYYRARADAIEKKGDAGGYP